MNGVTSRASNAAGPDLAGLMSRVVNPRHGIFRSIAEMPAFPDSPPMIIANAAMVNPIHFRAPEPMRDHLAWSNGAGLTRTECLWATIGEGIERYAASIYYNDQLVTASASELGQQAADVTDFVLYADEQYEDQSFPFKRFDPQLPRRWAAGCRVRSGEPILVPAQMVWLGYSMMGEHEHLLQNVSTGLGAASSIEGAIFTGLREVLERDAFVSHWLLREPGRRIALSPDQIALYPPEFGGLLENAHGKVTLRLLTNEFNIPVVAAIVQDHHSKAIAVGAACHPSLFTAIYKAVVEAWHTRYWTLDLLLLKPDKFAAADVVSFEDHVRYYRHRDHVSNVDFFLNGQPEAIEIAPEPAPPVADANCAMVEAIAAAGYDVIAVEVTTPDVEDLGLYAAKVLVPGLQPLYCGVSLLSRDTRRLDRVARRLGRAGPQSINVDPHPFP